MSLEEADLRVEITEVQDITPMEGKDRIELVWLYNKSPNGEPCIVSKGKHKIGDLICYIPPDHVVPDVSVFAFLSRSGELAADEKHVRHKYRRVRAMKMSGYISHGVVISLDEMDKVRMEQEGIGLPTGVRKAGTLVGAEMGITRWEPMRTGGTGTKGTQMGTEKGPKGLEIPKYDLTGIRKLADIFQWEEQNSPYELVVTEKLHGCNARFIVTREKLSWLKKTWIKFTDWICRRPPTMELFQDGDLRLHLASRTVWRGTKHSHKSVWKEVAENLALFSKLKKIEGLVVYGEIVGRRIQGEHFLYGTRDDNVAFYVFDIYNPVERSWLSWRETEEVCARIGLHTVPVLVHGHLKKRHVEPHVDGRSTLPDTPMREGVVVRTNADMRTPSGGRMIMKWKSEAFLQKHA